MENKRAVGKKYEDLATEYLLNNGYTILVRNFSDRKHEIDIIAKKDVYLVFVEVKYRKTLRNGNPAEAVTKTKQKGIYQCARYFMYKNEIPEDTPCRFDVIAILGEEITHYEDAFIG